MAKIVAIVSLNSDEVPGGGAPIFIASSKEEREKVAFSLEKILDATVHDLKNGSYVLVDHTSEKSD